MGQQVTVQLDQSEKTPASSVKHSYRQSLQNTRHSKDTTQIQLEAQKEEKLKLQRRKRFAIDMSHQDKKPLVDIMREYEGQVPTHMLE
jgi:hypothetical protein